MILGVKSEAGWAFGLGLERIAMILFQIPDIRLFWTTDDRFLLQFQPGIVTSFKPYSKYPPITHDISFWLPTVREGQAPFHENDFCDIVRDIAGDIAEDVKLVGTTYRGNYSILIFHYVRSITFHIPKLAV